MRRPLRSVVLPVVGTVALLALAACTDGGAGPATSSTTTPSATSTPTASPSATADETAAVLETYHRYWDAVVVTQQGVPDPTLFDGIATGKPVETEVAAARQFQELGIVRQGAPTFSQETVTIDGDTALVLACVDNSNWFVPDVPDDPAVPDVLPGGVVLTRTDGVWLVTETQQPPAEFTC